MIDGLWVDARQISIRPPEAERASSDRYSCRIASARTANPIGNEPAKTCRSPGHHISAATHEIDKPFRRDLLSSRSTGDRAAKNRARGCKPDRAASTSLLTCGTRAPLSITAPLPLADEPLVGLFGVAGKLDLAVA
jgi:hypothetical protein